MPVYASLGGVAGLGLAVAVFASGWCLLRRRRSTRALLHHHSVDSKHGAGTNQIIIEGPQRPSRRAGRRTGNAPPRKPIRGREEVASTLGEAWHQHSDDGHPPPPSAAGFSSSFSLDASASLQFNELTSDLHETLDELKREIASELLAKEQALADFKALQERLAVLDDRLIRDYATRAQYDLSIQAAEAAHERIVGTSQALVGSMQAVQQATRARGED
jgi:hypothetical protein